VAPGELLLVQTEDDSVEPTVNLIQRLVSAGGVRTVDSDAKSTHSTDAPKAALLSHSNFGSSELPSAQKMRRTLELLQQQAAWLEVDGEMHGDVALDAAARHKIMPRSTLAGDANLLVLPNIDAANIAYNLLKTAAGGGIAIGPVLLGAARPVHILTPSATVRRIVNMTALTVANANAVH